MIATEIEKGSRMTRNVGELPVSLQTEVQEAEFQYAQPGCVFLAYKSDQAIGVAGLTPHGGGVAELNRLFVLSTERGGVGNLLLKYIHGHADEVGIGRIVLDVMESRSEVVEWYRRSGYMETGRFLAGDVPMVAMERIADLST